MDDRIYDEFGSKRRVQNTENKAPGRNSRAGDFKLSIDFDAVEKQEAAKLRKPAASSATNTAKRSAGNDFKVSIPSDKAAVSGRTTVYKPSEKSSAGKNTAPQPSRKPAVSKNGMSMTSKTAKSKTDAPKKRNNSTAKQKLTPAQLEKVKVNKKYMRTKAILVACVCLIFIAVLTTAASTIAIETIDDILSVNKEVGESISVVIPDGAKFEEVYNAISESGLVQQKAVVKLFCKFRHYDKYYSSKQQKYVDVEYVPGVYYFEKSDSIETMLEQIKVSSTVSKDTVRVTFPEGWTIAQIFEKIEKYNVCTAEKLYANLDIVAGQFDFYKNIKDNPNRYLKAEGYLFPDTYDFYINESANSVLKKLFSNYNKKWTKAFDDQAKKLGLTQDQVMILASIIQGEAKGQSQMGGVSSVLHNRLKNSATYPYLQMDSTRDYIKSIIDLGVLPEKSAYLNSYSTYSSVGLPPSAICNPGIDAIKAALYPDDTNYNFFCHDKNGYIYYAVTDAEHEKNKAKILYED